MQYEIVIADPAKNITLFVLNQVENRAEAARLLLGVPGLGAEQVGFVIPPQTPQGLWRLEMMGGEFCGNAARSFGLFVARTLGYAGMAEIPIGMSGMRDPLIVKVNVEAGTAEVAIPKPAAQDTLIFTPAPDIPSLRLPVYCFTGIIHVIAPGISPGNQGKALFYAIKAQVERSLAIPQALGVMFYDQEEQLMTPAVYVYATDSLVFESSCGSGSAALGAWQHETLWEGEGFCRVAQPGGAIDVRVHKRQGSIQAISIGGPVYLKERLVIDGMGPLY
ncbi:putative histidine racemase [Hollandina sp. SP2]